MSDLPELRFLDEAARAAGWGNYRDVSVSVPSHKSVVAHARTLQKLAELEAENAWRPIEEDHPHNKSVILAWEDWRDGKWIMDIGPISTGKRYSNGYSTISQHGSATHFRPLPSPPEGPDA